MMDDSQAWAELHDASTSAGQLAAIAASHPQYAGAIARHPNAYPALVEWAGQVAGASPGAVAHVWDAPDASRSRRDARIWTTAFVAVLVLPVAISLVSSVLLFSGGIPIWLLLLDQLPAAVVLVAAAMTAQRRRGLAIGLGAAAVPAGFLGEAVSWVGVLTGADWLRNLIYPLTFASGLRIVLILGLPLAQVALMFLCWAVARPLRGRGYVALIVGIIVWAFWYIFLAQILWYSFGNRGVAGVLNGVIVAAITAGVVLLARALSGVSERRERSAAGTPAPQDAAVLGAQALPVARMPQTNTMAILAFVFLFLPVGGILPVIFGHVSLSQIRRTGEQGRGLAMAAVILGYVWIAAVVVLIIVWIAIMSAIGNYSY